MCVYAGFSLQVGWSTHQVAAYLTAPSSTRGSFQVLVLDPQRTPRAQGSVYSEDLVLGHSLFQELGKLVALLAGNI